MASRRTDKFLEAKQVLRNHPGLSDDELAVRLGLSPLEVPDIIPVARMDVAADQGQRRDQTTIGERPIDQA